MTEQLKPGERAKIIMAAAIENGVFTCVASNEVVSCLGLHAKRFLDRDKHDANTFFPTQSGRAKYGVVALESAPLPDPAHGRVAVRRRVDTIDSGNRLRPVDASEVERLKPSIRESGLRTPITVQGKPTDAKVVLAAGGHRLEAMRQLGEEWIDCFHEDMSDLDRDLWEIDENLCRAELTPADKALFNFRRKEIHLLKYPETAAGGDRRSKRQNVDLIEDAPKSFAVATADATGQDRKTIERAVSRGSKIVEMALHLVRGTRLDSGTFLDRLKMVPEENQVLYVKAALDDEKRKAVEVKENRRKLAEVRHAVRLVHMANVTTNGAAQAGQVAHRFPVIYADPPWKFGVFSEVTGRDKSPENHYPTMSTTAIAALFEQIGAPAKKDAVLFLWATNPMLPDALKVMEAWGFTYVHHWIWDKEVAGTGYWGRDRHELLLIGKRGAPVAPLPGSQPQTVHREAKGRHSAKPEHFAEVIERLYPDMPRLEMFCRLPRPGWTAWGYEAGATCESEVA